MSEWSNIPERDPDHPMVAIICAADFPSTELIGEVIAVGYDRDPETTWLLRARDKLGKEAFDQLSIEYTPIGLNPFWKWEGGDKRNVVRDEQMLNACTRVIVFCTPDTKTLDAYRDEIWKDKVRFVERGKPKIKRQRKGKSLE